MPTFRSGAGAGAGPQAPSLKVAEVARRLGVAPATLRTWARRYELGPSAHVAGAHRQYSAADVARLEVMRRLTLEGVAPAEAARIASAEPVDAGRAGEVASVTSLPSPVEERGPAGPDLPGAHEVAWSGRVVQMPAAGSAARDLARAATSLDDEGCRRILAAALGRDGVARTWEELVRPVFAVIGKRWESTGAGIDVEHLFSEAVLHSLRSAPAARRPRSSSSALLACAENEQHSLPLHVLAAALGERGVTARVLGARVPRRALTDAVARLRPAVVLVYAAMPVEDSATLAELPRLRPAPQLFVGGRGWAGVALPAEARRLASLPESVEQIASALGV